VEHEISHVVDATPLPAVELDTIYQGEVGYVWLTLRRLGVLEPDLEDVAHDVFVTVHRNLRHYDRDRPVRPWLFGIALRIAANYRRGLRRRREVAIEHEAADAAPRPDEHLARARAQQLVFAALDTLSPVQRAVFVLHELEGKPVPVIANELDVPLNTVYSRLRLARERFGRAVGLLRRNEEAP
jgi:RNA polymerase sigma-70 factor (ECF subfamily)